VRSRALGVVDADYLVIGSGIAGLTFAQKVSRSGKVALVTKKEDTESNTNYAQGGIAGVLGDDDSIDLHVHDTLVAGAGLCRREAVDLMVQESAARVQELRAMGVAFQTVTAPDGTKQLELGKEGGHSVRRIAHAQDRTGSEVEKTLVSAAKRDWDIALFENHLALDLIVSIDADGRRRCHGAYVLDIPNARLVAFHARATCLAAGGLGRIYLHTTNPRIATGDGFAIAYRAGCRMANMEFIQFHPTSLCRKDADSFLISEAVRGEGGILRLADGSTFMKKYHSLGSLAPRDIVARAIDHETKQRGEECAYLDVTHLDPEFLRSRFPTIYATCLRYGIDITKDWIPVVPAAHYSCGGVDTDLHGRTTIDGLYAAGEVACTGVHGANRLASNSLLEALVFGARAGEHAAEAATGYPRRPPQDMPVTPRPPRPKDPPNAERLQRLAASVPRAMWDGVGIVRSERGLRAARETVAAARDALAVKYRRRGPHEDLVEAWNMAETALLVIRSALMRHESRGLHFMIDYPQPDDLNYKRDTLLGSES
jgi:L-aspartate oxidase